MTTGASRQRRALHIRLRELVRRARRSLAAPVEVALRREIVALREQDLHRLGQDLEALRHEPAALRQELAGLREELASLRHELAGVRASAAIQLEEQRARTEALEGALAGAATALVRAPAQAGSPDRPRISVVLPTRDRERLVQEAIRSVLAQTFTGWELLVVDDGSQDGTVQALGQFLADPRVRLLRSPHVGVARARNLALREARGELVAYIDSDNLWFPGFLDGMAALFDGRPEVETAYGVLVADTPYFGGSRILWRPFDRQSLIEHNSVDLGTFVHRRRLFEELGGFDERLHRLVDWDLILRYTERTAARPAPVLSTYYRTQVEGRITDTCDVGSSWFEVRRKWLPRLHEPRPRVLYALWHYPQVTETYVEAEIRSMLRHGVEIEVWSEVRETVPYQTSVRVHRGTLAEALDAFRPDLVHSHWITSALGYEPTVAARGLPMTVRAHGFETGPEVVRAALARESVRKLYLFPHQLCVPEGERVRALRVAFETALFQPAREKDRRLVLRTAAALPAKDLGSFLSLAAMVPELRFVLVAATCTDVEQYPAELQAMAARMGSPAELRLDLRREEAAALVTRAGLYVHTAVPPGEAGGSPIGMPVSIAEAMATGAHVLVRDLPPLREYVGDAGAAYRDLEEAAVLLRRTLRWGDEEWRRARIRAVDRAFMLHADDTTLRPMLDDWATIVAERRRPAPP